MGFEGFGIARVFALSIQSLGHSLRVFQRPFHANLRCADSSRRGARVSHLETTYRSVKCLHILQEPSVINAGPNNPPIHDPSAKALVVVRTWSLAGKLELFFTSQKRLGLTKLAQ
jgi:hypothetical protein